MREIMDRIENKLLWVSSHWEKIMWGIMGLGVVGVALVAGLVWGMESNTPIQNKIYTVTLQATEENPIAIVGNSVTGEVECWDAYGIVRVIGSYIATVNGQNISSGRTLNFDGTPNGSMTNITMNMKITKCVGTGTWKGKYSWPN